MRDACREWDSDWGACGQCDLCEARQQSEALRSRLDRIERQLERLMESMGLEYERL